jgi:arylformamidase
MKILDISVPIHNGMPVYAGDPEAKITPQGFPHPGYTIVLSHLDLGAHTGTHVDAPLHFVPGGKTVDQLDLNTLVGPAHVVDLTQVKETIHAEDFERVNLPQGVERIICKTRNSALWDRPGFQTDFVALAWEAADWLVRRGIKLVGIDYLSAETYGVEPHSHIKLLGAGVIIVEGLNLQEVAVGEYILACLPLRLLNAEGAPARAILMQGTF